MKTIREALLDDIIYPIPEGKVDNKMISRGLNGDELYDFEIANSNSYKGCFADCLVSLLQAVSFSEADKSVSALSDEAKKKLLNIANSIYKTIGEEEVVIDPKPTVYINC